MISTEGKFDAHRQWTHSKGERTIVMCESAGTLPFPATDEREACLDSKYKRQCREAVI
jgi:hypothetical protein